MTTRHHLLGAISDYVRHAGKGHSGTRAFRSWARVTPELGSAGTVLAILLPRLVWIVSGWKRAGVEEGDLDDMEAELVGGTWDQIREITSGQVSCPGRPGLEIPAKAWQAVRDKRRTERRRAARLVPMDPGTADTCPLPACHGEDRPGALLLAGVVTDAVRNGSVTIRCAQAFWLTRVVGYPTDEAAALIGCSPAVLRVYRSRATRRLTCSR